MPEAKALILSDYAGGGPGTGGAGHVVVDSYRALEALGVPVELATGFGDPPVPAISLGGGDLREGGGGGAVRAIWNRAARAALGDLLARHDPRSTVVLLHQWTRYLSPASIGLLARFPVMVHLHDHFWACPNGAYYHFPHREPCDRQPLGPRCLAAACDRAGRVVKLGRVARHTMLAAERRSGRERRVLLHLSDRGRALIAPLLPDEHHAIVHDPLEVAATAPAPAPEPQFDIGYMGRLEPEKGLAPLLHAVRANRWSALVVGDGSMATRTAATPGVTWRRWVDRAAVAQQMRRCRVIVLPSLWPETWGLIVAEAMAAGVPVLVSRRAGSAELVERFGGGAIFDPGRPGDLSATLATLLGAPPPPLETWAGFRDLLSPRRHAQAIVDLASQRFGIDLVPSTTGASNSTSRAPVSAQV